MERSMTEGNPGQVLIKFALPLALANLLQQFYNIADTIIIGKFVSSDGLAAVGNATNLTFIFLSVATGFGMGTSVIISQFFGAKKYKKVKITIYTGLITSFALGLIIMSAGLFLCRDLLELINTPGNIISMSESYLRIFLFGIIFLFIFNICNSIFQALGDSKVPFIILMFSTLLNVVMDIICICLFNLGISGAAWATFFSELISVILAAVLLYRQFRKIEGSSKGTLYNFGILKRICRIALPSILQHSVMSLSSLLVQSLINSCGAAVIAGYTAAVKVDNLASSPMVNIGSAVSTFSAQNIGARKYDRVKNGIHSAIILDIIISAAIVLSAFLFGNELIGLFVKQKSDTRVISIGVQYLKIACTGNIVQGLMHIYGGILRGSGDMKGFLAVFCSNMISRVIFAYILFTFMGRTGIWLSVVIGWLIGVIIGFIRYSKENWMKKSLI